VTDATGAAVGSGSVVLVPASAVAELADTDIDLTLPPDEAAAWVGDEPLEDVIDAQRDSLPRAAVGTDGFYTFEELPDGDHFMVWLPSADDPYHLPGGDAARAALARDSLAGTRRDLRVSGQPGADATYVGSAPCLTCHGRHRVARTAHAVGLSLPGMRGELQDGAHFPRLDALAERFEAGVTLYFWDCLPTPPETRTHCKVTEQDPGLGGSVSFTIELLRDLDLARSEPGAFSVRLRNRSAPGERTYPIALTYGGALTKQQPIARVELPGGGITHHVLPFALQLGGDLRAEDPGDWPFADDHSERWYDFTASALREPDADDSFDQRCAGCHYTGFALTGSTASGWLARAVPSAEGSYDSDGDGRREEINVGCESCHGPGSEHLERSPRGGRIVSPSLLTPERAALVCGRCHSRPEGRHLAGSEAPLDALGTMPRPGLRRAEYLRDHVSRADAAETDLWPSGDAKSHHAQYSEFLRSTKHRKGPLLLTCESCHDPHGSDAEPHELARSFADNAVCTECHAGDAFTDVRVHVERATGDAHRGSSAGELTCNACHMVDTARSGARRFALLDIFPAEAQRVQYMHGDVSSHRFRTIARAEAGEQPAPFTQACAVCHGVSLPNP
jgi:predicted CXXCH cytochrome family protein